MLSANSKIATQQASEELELTDADLKGVVGGLITVAGVSVLSGNDVDISDITGTGIGGTLDSSPVTLNDLFDGFLGL